MTESPIDEVMRILTTWPEAERADGVLRVMRRIQEDAESRAREEERTNARLMIAQIRCCSCEEFVHNLDPNCDGCGMCRPVREWLRARAKQEHPPYNHTRGDSELTPCELCAEIRAKQEGR